MDLVRIWMALATFQTFWTVQKKTVVSHQKMNQVLFVRDKSSLLNVEKNIFLFHELFEQEISRHHWEKREPFVYQSAKLPGTPIVAKVYIHRILPLL